MTSDSETINRMNAMMPKFVRMLGGQITGFDTTEKICTATFDVGKVSGSEPFFTTSKFNAELNLKKRALTLQSHIL